MALIIAVVVAFVVVLLSMAAVTQSMNTITQAGIGGKQVSSTDAAEAGIQFEVAQIEAAAATTGTGAKTFNCPASTTTTLSSNGSITASYSVQYALTSTAAPGPTSATTATLQSMTMSPCTGSPQLEGGSTYLISSTGTTSAGGIASKTEETEIYVPAVSSYATSSAFNEALYAGVDLLGSGAFKLSGGNVYTGWVSACGSSIDVGGNYYSAGIPLSSGVVPSSVSVPTLFTGACSVGGNLYMNSSLGAVITSGSGVGGNLYDAGIATLSGGATVGQSLYADGAVSMSGGATVGGQCASLSASPVSAPITSAPCGSIVSGGAVGGVSLSGGTIVDGNVYSAGPVTMVSGTVDGNIYAGGAVTLTAGAVVKGTIYSDLAVTVTTSSVHAVDSGVSVTYLDPSSAGAADAPLIVPACILGGTASSCTIGVPAGYPFADVPTLSAVSSLVNAEIVIAANSVNGTSDVQSTAVSFPTFTYDAVAWQTNDSGFCGASTACTASTVRELDFTYTSGSTSACDLTTGSNGELAPDTLWGVIASMEQPGAPPTIITTNCQFSWGYTDANTYLESNAEGNYSLPLYNSLAIFDTAGFNIPSDFGGFSSANGAKYQLYLVVPSSPGTNVLPTAQSLLNPDEFPSGEATCNLVTGPDINLSASLTDSGDNIEDFLYTPSNICSYGGNVDIFGRVYAGGEVVSTSNTNIVYYPISPWASGAGSGSESGTSSPGTPTIEWIK